MMRPMDALEVSCCCHMTFAVGSQRVMGSWEKLMRGKM